VWLRARARHAIGLDVPREQWISILRLDDLLHARTPFSTEGYAAFGVSILEDRGLIYHSPGNPSGGEFPGRYRDFLVRTPEGEDVIFGLRVSDTQKTVNHPTWGNRKGRSYLMACLSYQAAYEPVLEYDLSRYARFEPDRIELWHSGRATVGKGAVKNSQVLELVRERCPELVRESKVYLGAVPLRPAPRWEEVREWVARMAAYVVARHEMKLSVRKRRRRNRARREKYRAGKG
jgi:hypothetical protein